MSIKIAITLGDPGGIGPDICVLMAERYIKKNYIVITDPQLLIDSAKKLNKKVYVNLLNDIDDIPKGGNCLINVLPIKLNKKNKPGYMNPSNASFVINTIKTAAKGCLNHNFHSMVTGPISKSILNRGGFKISGHTELLAKLCKSKSIMMLMNDKLKVTLQTIHIPLNKVSKQITKKNIIEKIKIINHDLINKFGLIEPRILVCGLNPHAGEEGILGSEEINIIKPAIEALKKQGVNIDGPVPADTAFTSDSLNNIDVVLAMYHDQGLPVLKANGFKNAANITLGLPFIRTSVDHGTALDLAGTGKIDLGSFKCALSFFKKNK